MWNQPNTKDQPRPFVVLSSFSTSFHISLTIIHSILRLNLPHEPFLVCLLHSAKDQVRCSFKVSVQRLDLQYDLAIVQASLAIVVGVMASKLPRCRSLSQFWHHSNADPIGFVSSSALGRL
jgi:hypothetical protein